MFTVSIETAFKASHQLTLSDGSKEPSHNHDWKLTAAVSAENLNKIGLVIDFHRLKAAVDQIIAGLDNTNLSKIDYFQRNNPSAENVAKYIYEKLEPELKPDVKIEHIIVVEEPGCSAKFTKSL